MAINLSKGGNINLAKEAPGVSIFRVGLGWDVAAQAGTEFDLDAIAIPLKDDGKCVDQESMVFYGNLTWKDAIKHSGDNRTGAGEGDDETITIDTAKVPAECTKIDILVNIHDAKNRQQNFGLVKNAKVNLYSGAEGTEVLAKYDLEEDASMSRALVFCQLYKKDGEWKFKAINESKGSFNEVLLKNILEGYGFTGIEPNI